MLKKKYALVCPPAADAGLVRECSMAQATSHGRDTGCRACRWGEPGGHPIPGMGSPAAAVGLGEKARPGTSHLHSCR